MWHEGSLLTLERVAELLAVPLKVVEQLADARTLRVLRIGPERRVRPAELEAFLRRSEE